MPKYFQPKYLPYSETSSFSKIILDYIDQAELLKPFFLYPPTLEGIKQSIIQRQATSTNRELLVEMLKVQYAETEMFPTVKKNIELLAFENTFTVCTAHQPNIFTGHLYFIYKILHTIKLAAYLNTQIAENNFVPIFYMGSEDADLEELGHIYLGGIKYEWKTKQTGAVGKMQVDDQLLNILEAISGQLSGRKFGNELLALLKSSYTKGATIQQATFQLINTLFKEYGLVVLIPGSPDLKRVMSSIFEDDILNNTPCDIVEETSKELSKHFKVQAQPREINLFYLKDNIRSRLINKNNIYYVENTGIKFTEEEIKAELTVNPGHFSPNVILRGLYQETILPNLAFIGGGGELAYWLELKDLFKHYNVPYPALILRNSFTLVDNKTKELAGKLQLGTGDLFKDENTLMNQVVKNESTHQLYLTLEKQQLADVYEEVKKAVQEIDITLKSHAEALLSKSLKHLGALEHKMLKAEKRKFEARQRQIKKIKSTLFPLEDLQERVENFMPFYAEYGQDFIVMLYENSSILQPGFCVLTEDDA